MSIDHHSHIQMNTFDTQTTTSENKNINKYEEDEDEQQQQQQQQSGLVHYSNCMGNVTNRINFTITQINIIGKKMHMAWH